MQQHVLSKEVISGIKSMIINDFGDLSDMPKELANTILNIYYVIYVRNSQQKNSKGPCFPNENFNAKDAGSAYMKFVKDRAFYIASIEELPGIVQSIREARLESIRDGGQVSKIIYDDLVNVTVDIFKYRIDNAYNKFPLRRMLERKLKKVDEIQNLTDIINFCD
jgi:hypothetical protein